MSVIYPAWKEANGTEHPQRVLFEGAVLADRERNGYDDSDFYVIAWDANERRLTSHEYATTRFGGGGWASVDATPATLEQVRRYLLRKFMQRLLRENVEQSRLPQVGRRVRVVKGRKIAIGTEAEVVWYGKGSSFSPSRWAVAPMRVGLMIDGVRVFTDASNVEVIGPNGYKLPARELAAQVRRAVRKDNVISAAISFMYTPMPGWALVA